MFLPKEQIVKWANVFRLYFSASDFSDSFSKNYQGIGLITKDNTVEKFVLSNKNDFTMHDIFQNENVLSSILWDTIDMFFNQSSTYYLSYESLKEAIENEKTDTGKVNVKMAAISVNTKINQELNAHNGSKTATSSKDFPLLEDVVCFFTKVLGYDYDAIDDSNHRVKILSDTTHAKAEWKIITNYIEYLHKVQGALNRFSNLEEKLNLTDFDVFFKGIAKAEEKRSELSTKECRSLYLGFTFLKETVFKNCAECKAEFQATTDKYNCKTWIESANACKNNWDSSATQNYSEAQEMLNNISTVYTAIKKLNDDVAPAKTIAKYLKFNARDVKSKLSNDPSAIPEGFTFDQVYSKIMYYAKNRSVTPPSYDDDLTATIAATFKEVNLIYEYCVNKYKICKNKEDKEQANQKKKAFEDEYQKSKKDLEEYGKIIIPERRSNDPTVKDFTETQSITSVDEAITVKDYVNAKINALRDLIDSIESFGGSTDNLIITYYRDTIIKELSPLFEDAKSNVIPKLEYLCQVLQEKYVDNPLMPKERKSDVIDISDFKQTEKVGNNAIVTFSLMDESYSELFFEDPDSSSSSIDFHDYSTYHKLVDAAVNVKKQPIFSDYGDIESYPCFKPFKYQLDSVRTMLTRFEGRGVFGDQVGLGKTIQALITADVMARCGAIKNAVIVANEHIIGQWRKECENKFRLKDNAYIFDLTPSRESQQNSYSLDELIEKLKEDSKGDLKGDESEISSGLKIYFLSTEKLKEDGSIRKLKEAKEAIELEAELYKDKNLVAPLDNSFKALYADLNNERCLARLYKIADKLIDEYNKAWAEDPHMIKRNLVDNYKSVIHGCELYESGEPKTVNGGYVWDHKKPAWFISEHNKRAEENLEVLKDSNGYFFSDIIKYNKKLEEIRVRCNDLESRLEEIRNNAEFYKERLIDLIIFDEVQDLLISFSKKDKLNDTNSSALSIEEQKEIHKNADNNRLIQEFIATIQKKYAILISATPIRDDLDDIFNLLYMVDKTRLGDTIEEAKKRFYEGYCDGYWSLSDMANSDNPEEAFSNLNGLINSRFTRKRLYDSDVLECMCRQCATQEEIDEAKRLGRDDFGGVKFRTLVEVVSLAYKLLNPQKDTDSDSLTASILSKKDLLFKDYFADDEYEKELPNEDYLLIVKEICQRIDKLKNIAVNRENIDLKELVDCNSVGINICQRFLDSYDRLVEYESLDDGDSIKVFSKSMVKKDAVKYALNRCNTYCSFINKGLLDLFNNNVYSFDKGTLLRYPYLSDFIDRRRPPKKGISLICDSVDTKLDFISTSFNITESEELPDVCRKFCMNTVGLSNEEVMKSIQQNKVLLFEKDNLIRRDIFRLLRDTNEMTPFGKRFGDRRRVYVNLPTDANERDAIGYTDEEYLDLCYYDEDGKNSNACKETYSKILDKWDNGEPLTTEEQFYVKRYHPNKQTGIPCLEGTYANKSLDWFKELSPSAENWNSVYLMNQSQIAGTNMEAANVMVISQLDFYKDGTLRYLDPLEFEQLIGRISRTGQTEECIVYTCLYNGSRKNELAGINTSVLTSETYDEQFNELYYEILSDPDGFDLFGKCNTEVDFVVPVVMACLRQLYTNEKSAFIKTDNYKSSNRKYVAVYEDKETMREAVEIIKNIETFPQMLQFAKTWNDLNKVNVYEKGKYVAGQNATEVIKKMVSTYASILSHNHDALKKDESEDASKTDGNETV